MSVTWPSFGSIWMQVFRDEVTPLATATGFVVLRRDRHYLITNRHVVSGRHWATNDLLDSNALTPRWLDLRVNTKEPSTAALMWGAKRVPVVTPAEDGFDAPLWYEHPLHGNHVDVVALPIDLAPHERVHAVYDPDQTPSQPFGVTSDLFIVGFPFGQPYAGFMSTWIRGSVASEPSLSFRDNLPVFAIDARARRGMSGSPVVYVARHHIYSPAADTTERVLEPYLVGIYSGRLNDDSDIGLVWHSSVISKIIDTAQSPDPIAMTRTRTNRW